MAKTLKEVIINYLEKKEGAVATLKEIYSAISESEYESQGKTVDCSARTIIYRNKDTFKRIAKGIYMLQGEKSTSLLINGDSRSLEEIENDAIDCIITDHPWSDKKAHTSGNQKGFAEYETFTYTAEDFKNKARVLKDGAYLVEFLPVESATNWQYLSQIKQFAKEAGLEYYASCIWRKAPEGAINNGRTTKGVEQFLIFSKGKPRRLAPKGKPYMTKNMLSFEVDIPIKAKDKHHQAEKPLELYKYLIENLTEEQDVCLDQFGGACNMVKAATDLNRFAVVYELAKDFVHKAVERFNMTALYKPEEIAEEVPISKEETVTEILTIEVIPEDVTEFQKNFLVKLSKSSKKDLLNEEEWSVLSSTDSSEINKLFAKANSLGYLAYKKPEFDIDLQDYMKVQPLYDSINRKFEKMFDAFVRPYYENIRIENQCFAEYLIKYSGKTLADYLHFIKKNFPEVNSERTERILTANNLVA